MESYLDDFVLPNATYLLSHSVGRPLKSQQLAFEQTFFTPWQTSAEEPWAAWLTVVDEFCQALGRLFATDAGNFCPQV
ncbi:MAG: aminotransferase, partial [Shewanella sp.]|nr:aminotransferase [Shewanella sp.]